MGEGQGKRTAIDSHASIDRLIARSDQHPIAIALVFIVFAPSMEALFVIGITAHFTVPLLLQPQLDQAADVGLNLRNLLTLRSKSGYALRSLTSKNGYVLWSVDRG
jgi:hypothetical protein